MLDEAVNHEASKYEQMWAHPEYRAVAPGEHIADTFIKLARPQTSHTVIDFGCGTGRGALRIHARTGATVEAVDFTSNCLDAEVAMRLNPRFTFTQHDLLHSLGRPAPADFGFCTDVMEHIPPEDVKKVLLNIVTAAKQVFFAISLVDDVMGKLIGEPLHLTVQDAYWWHETLTEIGFRVDWSNMYANDTVACFYGSAYANAADIADLSSLNIEEERARENIRKNLDLGLQEIIPHQIQKEQVVYLLAGGPSLTDFEEQIITAGKAGQPIVTVNGTYNWLIERGVRPAAQVMVDARGFNKRFLEPRIDTCKYLLSSQCDHEMVKSMPREQTWLWHAGESQLVKDVLLSYAEEKGAKKEWYPVYGGSTVISRAVVMLAMLGFRKVEVFGWDSCLRDDKHHAYAQPENDGDIVFEVKVGERTFRCNPWMLIQAHEFPKIVHYALSKIEDFELAVHGDGLISALLNNSAELAKGN